MGRNEWSYVIANSSDMVYREMTEAPGKYQGLPAYAPFLWEMAGLDGWDKQLSSPDGTVYMFTITPADCEVYPELAREGITRVYLWECVEGFVRLQTEDCDSEGAFEQELEKIEIDLDFDEYSEVWQESADRRAIEAARLDALADMQDD